MTTNKELESIAKQVFLLNRFIELLRMQEEPKTWDLIRFGGFTHLRDGIYRQFNDREMREYSFQEAWDNDITQKAWADELVRAARALSEAVTEHMFEIKGILNEVCVLLKVDITQFYGNNPLEAILNKYGRSLDE